MSLCKYKILIVLIIHLVHSENLNDPCVTPNGELAECVSLNECEIFSEHVLRESSNSVSVRHFLRKSLCRTENEVPIICCGSDYDFKNDTTVISKNCGTSKYFTDTDSIELIKPGEFPWTVYLEYDSINKPTKKTYICSGSLIHHRYVLTAAHCVIGDVQDAVGNVSKVVIGDSDISSEIDCDVCKKPVVIEIEEVIPHENFSKNFRRKYQQNDIALLRLKTSVTFNDYIQPICLTPSQKRPRINATLHVLTWRHNKEVGSSNNTIQTKLKISVINQTECRNIYDKNYDIKLMKNQLCAIGKNHTDTCYGDGGGSLMSLIGGKFYVEGIVSFGPTVCGTTPSIYTWIANYKHWIVKHVHP